MPIVAFVATYCAEPFKPMVCSQGKSVAGSSLEYHLHLYLIQEHSLVATNLWETRAAVRVGVSWRRVFKPEKRRAVVVGRCVEFDFDVCETWKVVPVVLEFGDHAALFRCVLLHSIDSHLKTLVLAVARAQSSCEADQVRPARLQIRQRLLNVRARPDDIIIVTVVAVGAISAVRAPTGQAVFVVDL